MKYLPKAHRSNVSTAAQIGPTGSITLLLLLLQNIAEGKVPCNSLIVADDAMILLPYS